MNTYIYLTFKYWKKHKKNLAALLFAGVLLTAVVFVTLMTNRERWVRKCHSFYDASGRFDLMIYNSDDELITEILNDEKGYRDDYKYGAIYVYGKIGTDEIQLTYGSLDDKHDLLHPPLDEGRMPETDTELIATVQALENFFWPGKCGDTITLDGKTYTVVGIINEKYDDGRYGTDEELYKEYAGANGLYALPYRLPSIFVGQCDKEPLYRIDMFNDFFAYPYNQEWDTPYSDYEYHISHDIIGYESSLSITSSDYWVGDGIQERNNVPFFIVIAWIGAAVAVLSVYSILKNVFADRRGRLETLKKLGMSNRSVGGMLAVECGIFTLIQTIFGLAIGLGVYGGIYLFKTSVLGEKPHSGFENIRHAIECSPDPFLLAVIISVAVMVAAYIISALTSKLREKTPKSGQKTRSLSRCLGRIFRQHGISVVQTIALSLICLSAVMGYAFFTESGKYHGDHGIWLYMPPFNDYKAGKFDMEEHNIAEYYKTDPPSVTTMTESNRDPIHGFPLVTDNYTKGIGDDIAEQLPEHALATGYMQHTFLASDRFYGFLEKIILTGEFDLTLLTGSSDEETRAIVEQIQSDELKTYCIYTKLADAQTLSGLSEYVTDGAVNIDAINSGTEILITYSSTAPPFEAGETITICSALQREELFGISDVITSEVRVGALIKIPSDMDAVKKYTLRDDQKCNFLTTVTGARAMDMPCASYSEIYSSEPMNGGIIPPSAEMTLASLARMKRKVFIEKAISVSGMLFILVLMALMGFAAYFNGIGVKIREKSYEISVLRAVGTPVSALRKRLLLGSIKIPVIATAIAYCVMKAFQFVLGGVVQHVYDYWDANLQYGINLSELKYDSDFVNWFLESDLNMFLEKGMWMVKTELPFLILCAVICAVTFILTAVALKKFKGNIAGDLNEGRKRR